MKFSARPFITLPATWRSASLQVAEARDRMSLASANALLQDKHATADNLRRAAAILREAASNLDKAAAALEPQ
jgi:hypothetical protein